MDNTHQSSFLAEMELVKDILSLTPEERKAKARGQMYVELKAIETTRRQKLALASIEKCRRERQERDFSAECVRRRQEERRRQEAGQREQEENRAKQLEALEETRGEQLKQERLLWEKVMKVEEELVKHHKVTLNAQKREQPRREEAHQLCSLQRKRDRASTECYTFDPEAEKQGKKKTLCNNWVVEQEPETDNEHLVEVVYPTDIERVKENVHPTDSEAVTERYRPTSATYRLFLAKSSPKSEGSHQSPQSGKAKRKETWQRLQSGMRVGFWLEKYQDHRQREEEKRTLKAEEQYEKWTAYKMSRASQYYRQHHYYTGGFAANRNSILKSIF